MRKTLLSTILASTLLLAEDYGFSMDEIEAIETKSYEFSGYMKGEYKYQLLNKDSSSYPGKNKHSQDRYLGELFFDYKYFRDKLSLEIETAVNYENIDGAQEDTVTLNQGFLNYKFNDNHQINGGKISSKWGKGYFFNPVAFIDRKKDPNDPEAAREGFMQLNHKYNKVFKGNLQNLSFDTVFLRTTKDTNEYLYKDNSNLLALKLYILYRDIDIDFVYSYSDKDSNKYGVDFSTNLQTNFEIHGEYARYDSGYYSYLLGLKYLTENDLTIISEIFYQKDEQSRSISFWDNRYLINSFNQKEPFDLLYLNLYFKNMLNLDDDSFQNKAGAVYSGIKNLEIDLSLSKNSGKRGSEFGNKLVEKVAWLSLKYSF